MLPDDSARKEVRTLLNGVSSEQYIPMGLEYTLPQIVPFSLIDDTRGQGVLKTHQAVCGDKFVLATARPFLVMIAS